MTSDVEPHLTMLGWLRVLSTSTSLRNRLWLPLRSSPSGVTILQRLVALKHRIGASQHRAVLASLDSVLGLRHILYSN